jgi:hypothetical protein
MNPFQIVMDVIIVIAFVLAVISVAGVVVLLRRVDALTMLPATRRAALQALTDEARDAGSYAEPAPEMTPLPQTLPEWEDAWKAGQPEPRRAVPADPENMPRPWTYNGQPNRRKCNCHGRFLEPGESIIWWPRPDLAEGAVELYHFESLEGRS